MKDLFRIVVVTIMTAFSFVSHCVLAHEQEGAYYEEGLDWYFYGGLVENEFYDGIFYDLAKSDTYEHAVYVFSHVRYEIGGQTIDGGYYMGELEIPETMYGYMGIDADFTVCGLGAMYKNGLTALYLPETIEWIGSTIESCRFLEKVHLNNSLRVLDGVKDCPVLTECPLPLSLERISDGWMSGIAISETVFPSRLSVIGNGVFCNNPNLTEIDLGNLQEMGDSCFRQLPSLKKISLPESLQKMGDYCFEDCVTLESVTLPSNAVLAEKTFMKCPSIKEVCVYADTPYAFPDDCMKETDKKNCVLRVPKGSEKLYQEADGWKEFGLIEASLDTGTEVPYTMENEWRAFSRRGQLVIDSSSGNTISIYTLTGQRIAEIENTGRNCLSVATGVYIISAGGRSVKVVV